MNRANKLLDAMLRSSDPRQFRYRDAAAVLTSLGFEPARTKPSGSHRVWRRRLNVGDARSTVYIGLVDPGNGTIKPVYIKQMLAILLQHGLIQGGRRDAVE